MYKNFRDYSFREIAGHFVLIKNINAIKNAIDSNWLEERVEEIKKEIIEDTKKYYKDNFGYDDTFDFEDTFSIEALNEDMTTRKITDWYEPLYGYVCIEKNRGFILYLLGNYEDKVKYVFLPTYCSCTNSNLDDVKIEIIEDEEYDHATEFKEQIKDDEELDEDIINTRLLKEIDIFRLKQFPDFVTCFVPYKNANYTAKVKLLKYEDNNIYAKYHNLEGILKLIHRNNNLYLIFQPIYLADEEKELKEYINSITEILEKDYNIYKSDSAEIIIAFKHVIEKGYIKGDLPFEIANQIIDLIDNIEENEE